jgi:uncharacterized protein
VKSSKLVRVRVDNLFMNYEWDTNKAESNLLDHGVDFADAVSVFADLVAITIVDEHPDEERFITIGLNAFGQILVVVYTWRSDRIRIISARRATKREQRQYYEE